MTAEIHLRFYEELNDHLPEGRRKREFSFRLEDAATIGQMLQMLAVPAGEVELVLVNGESADLSRFLAAGDRVSIYPVFESLDVKSLLKVRREALRETRFVVDAGLHRLCFLLRMLGFDVNARICAAEAERRILLTRNAMYLNSDLSRVYVVRKKRLREQLREVLSRFDLVGSDRFTGLQRMVARFLTH